MTREEIKELARAAGVDPSDKLQAFAFAVAEAQRERSARLVWKRRSEWMRTNDWQRCEDACALMAKMEMEVRHA
jgi:hypothetical protein